MENITVIGIGRLGICTALILEKANYNVVGIDMYQTYVDSINNKSLLSYEPNVMNYLKQSNNFKATTDLNLGLLHSDIIFIVVPTPNGGEYNYYDHSILNNLLIDINKTKIKNKHLVICCTVMPNYINNIAKSLIKDCEQVTLNYNPEFIAQGNIISGFENPDLILIGQENDISGQILENIYKKICKNKPKICRMSVIEAEITKIAINGFITTKISYANMIADACERSGADKNIVLSTVGSDTRIGNKYLKPGYSYGGPCFPRDTRAIGHYIRSLELEPVLIEAVEKYNELHTFYQTNKMLQCNCDVYVFENVTYKENCDVPIIEESAKLKIAKIIAQQGKKVIIRDKEHIISQVKMEYGRMFNYEIIDM